MPPTYRCSNTRQITTASPLVNFALFDLVGKLLSPRIRDLGKITLIRNETSTDTVKRYPHAGPLLSARWNEDLIAECWPDLLRMVGSLKYGQATALPAGTFPTSCWPTSPRHTARTSTSSA
ncbi:MULTISPECIES: Tn3 family transposase [Nonomuraea]|uniref:Tn3 family transposase n=1 Tax=Nonomuraea mangrovi TaxID=2316207 RepID=A0ABW4SNM0_9ACTN